jgi:hypothetical protein
MIASKQAHVFYIIVVCKLSQFTGSLLMSLVEVQPTTMNQKQVFGRLVNKVDSCLPSIYDLDPDLLQPVIKR